MSVRSALIAGMLMMILLTAGTTGIVGALGIVRTVIGEAQLRVDQDLKVAYSLYSRNLSLLARQVELRARSLFQKLRRLGIGCE